MQTFLLDTCALSHVQLFVYASGAQDVLSHGAASSGPGRALAGGVGLMIAVYAGMGASGTSRHYLYITAAIHVCVVN